MRADDCQQLVDSLLVSHPKAQALLAATKARTRGGFTVHCRPCPETDSNAFTQINPLEITICSNRVSTSSDVGAFLLHELVHAYDYVSTKCRFDTCSGLAYSEIRAAREGECMQKSSYFQWQRDLCIRRHAINSTKSFFSDKEARACVDQVFDAAVLDMDPFLSNKEI